MREATKKASEEYRNERKLEIHTEDDWKFEETSSAEISNPNDEIPVTYLFYQLQRQYEISEKLQRIVPVILVANKIPAPHDIDEDWLIAHDWILQRVILDDSFLPALKYLSGEFAADEFIVHEFRNNLYQIREIVESLREDIASGEKLTEDYYESLRFAQRELAEEAGEGYVMKVLDKIYGEPLFRTEEGTEKRIENIQEEISRINKMNQELKSRLKLELDNLNVALRKYTEKLQSQITHRIQIDRLRLHVKNNILYYMQKIWIHENPDQRYYRLAYNQVFTTETPPTITYSEFQNIIEDPDIDLDHLWAGINKNKGFIKPDGELLLNNPIPHLENLSQVADITNLLGFFGNYMIFPLREENYLTLLLLGEYILDATGNLTDPDWLANQSIEDLINLVNEVDLSVFEHPDGQDHYTAVKKFLQDCIRTKLTSPYRKKETIVVPTESLFIEALPGKHPLLEDFKLLHRAIDVKKVKSEYRENELEILRKASRLLEGKNDDEIAKKIVIKSDTSSANVNIDSE